MRPRWRGSCCAAARQPGLFTGDVVSPTGIPTRLVLPSRPTDSARAQAEALDACSCHPLERRGAAHERLRIATRSKPRGPKARPGPHQLVNRPGSSIGVQIHVARGRRRPPSRKNARSHLARAPAIAADR